MYLERWISSQYNRVARGFCFLLSMLLIFLMSSVSSQAEEGSAHVYHRHENSEMKVALTFDDGPHPILTPAILKILARYKIKATFFLVGENVKNYPGVVEQILAEGHEIGNHTYSHDCINTREIEQCEQAIYELTDYKTKLFRPPQGFVDQSVKEASLSLGYDIILWDIDTRDWEHTPPRQICNLIVNDITAGSIILMHDYIGHNSPTPQALELLIPEVIALGYQFVPVSELIGTK